MSTLVCPRRRRILLGGDVVRRREGRRRPGEPEAALDDLVRHPEIDEPDRSVLAQDDVLGLQIVVHHLPIVQVRHGFAEAAHEAQRLFLRQPATLADARGERRAGDVLGHDVAAVLSRRQRDEPQDVRMIERAPDLGLALEHRPAAETARKLRQRDLHGHQPSPVLQVRRLEHGRHAAAPDLFEEDEAAFEGLAGSGFGRKRHGCRCLPAGRGTSLTPAFQALYPSRR